MKAPEGTSAQFSMKILGIESSCDETAAAVVEDGSRILSSVIGFADRDACALRRGGAGTGVARASAGDRAGGAAGAGTSLHAAAEELAAIAVTQGPGLVGSLLVGITYAKALALVQDMPLIAVNHIEGHIHAVVSQNPVEFPALALVVSGGHTHLFEVLEGFRYRLLGKTRDDAAGEAFDKVAKLLGFGYPGGPVIDMLAPHGDPRGGEVYAGEDEGQHARFQFQRNQDGGAALGGSSRYGGGDRGAQESAGGESSNPASRNGWR